ncbi:Cytochrome P450 [Reichenbachiella faecimaris]|uniref:Cytochrome P450 n=1 Tax=Reichenbachiella faecimaris TaxID=692418 RepID=A0A1W2GE42_REIFA|nr:cytochrome P450 [Reichenbachiella faecimaris]SMD34939.1 Cytochrome P450 [Reichenbachiella faecimaris]
MKPPKAFPENSKFQNLKKFQASPILYMKEAARTYGSPVDLNLPIGKFALISDPEQAQHVLASNHENYTKSNGYKQVALVLGNGLLTSEGEEWHRNRKMLQPSFHKNELRKLLPAVWETGSQYLSTLADNQALRLDTEMNGLTLTILLNSLIHSSDEEILSKMSGHVNFGQEFIVNRIRSPFKWPLWIPTKNHRHYHAMMTDSNDLIQRTIEERTSIGGKDIEDLLSVLLTKLDAKKDFIQIRDEILTFLVAGHETSSLGMTWMLHLLAHHPEIQNRLFEEVNELGDYESLDLMNFANLKYTGQVIKESMRLYPPIWNVVRKAKAQDRLGEFEIEEGYQLMNSIYELHHHPDYWENPALFDPDRFETYNFKHKFQYLPFGGGPRFCIGNNFALFEMTILLVQFVRTFKLKPLSPKEIGFNPLLTLRPNQLVNIQLTKRT